MVRETRHLWVGNLPDNIREDRIREHFKRYGRVQNIKLLGRAESANAGAVSGLCATVAFMDIKSAAKAHTAEHVLDERTLTTEYYEPAAIPSAAGAPSAGSSPAGSGYSGSSSSVNSAPAPASVSRYHLSGGEEGAGTTCAIAATAAAPANWRGTNDSATEFCRRGSTPAAYSRYQRNANAPYTTPPSNVESRTTPHQRWYSGSGSGERGATGGSSTPSTPGGRRRASASSSRSESSSPAPSDHSRASTPGPPAPPAPPPPQNASSTPSTSPPASHSHHHQWASTANGRPLAICVRNLPTRSTDSSLKDGLYHEYKKHGKVVWVKVVGQNADRYAVVRFKKPSDVEKALEVSQDKLFFGCKISVAPHQSCDEDADSAKPYETDIDEYHPKATRTLFIGNLEKDVTQQQLRDKFKHFGRIIEIDIKKGSGGGAGYAFCQYASISSVVEAIRAMDGEYVGGSRVKLGFGKPVATTCVWVDGLTEGTEKQVLGAVARCGAATSVCVDRAAGAALVHFEQAAAAGAAVRELRRVAAIASAADPDRPRLAVDYASRECQEAFYEQLEKHGGSATMPNTERLTGDLTPRYVPSTRHDSIRYDSCGSRSRASSYGRGSSRTPRYPSMEHYDPADYAADRRYRVYEELESSPQAEEPLYEDRLQSVVVSPHRSRRHRRDSSPEERKHSKERHRSVTALGTRRSRSGSRGSRHTGRRRHRRRRDGSGSRGSRAGTPLRDEPDAPPCEPRRGPRERPPLPMSLPLPKFAAQLLRAAAPPAPPAPPPAPHPASPPRPPSASSSSAGSAPHSPSLEERIRSLDEKYEKWSGTRALPELPDRTRLRHRLLELDINEVKPSDVVRSLLAKRSVFDEDSERLEGAVRPPSPNGSPRARPPPLVPRALRYPFPAHPSTTPSTPHTPLTPLAPLTPPTSQTQTSLLSVLPTIPLPPTGSEPSEPEASERPADPRLNRPERIYQPEKLGKFNESDYRQDPKIRLRTPSTDRPLECNERRQSPKSGKSDQDRREIDKPREILPHTKENDNNSVESTETKQNGSDSQFKKEISDIERSTENKCDISNDKHSPPISSDFSKESTVLKITDSSGYIPEPSLIDIPSPSEPMMGKTDEKDNTSNIENRLKTVGISSSNDDKKSKTDNSQPIIESKNEKFTLSAINDCDNYKDIIMHNTIKKELSELEMDLTAVNNIPMPKEISEITHEIVKNHDKNGKDRYSQNILITLHNAKVEKENIEFESISEKNSSEKKILETEKPWEDRLKADREKFKSSKDRLDHEKDKKSIRTSFEKHEKEKKSKDELTKSHLEKGDRGKNDKEPEKTHKDKIEDKQCRHEHRKDKNEKEKRKDNAEVDTLKTKKEEKHKQDKRKDSGDSKRENKTSEHSKSRKSSRDESSKDLCRKDSTDSSTSRTSHDSIKLKDLDIKEEIKEEQKPKLKFYNDLFCKQDHDKDNVIKSIDTLKKESTVKIRTETKEEHDVDQNSKNKTEKISELTSKPKADIIEKHRHYSVDSPNLDCKRKERLNSSSSLPSNIGHKRRVSSQDSMESLSEEIKKSKNEIKHPERRDSKDSRNNDKHKTTKFSKGHYAKIIESKTKDDKKNQVKPPDEGFTDTKAIDKDTKKSKKCHKSENEEKTEVKSEAHPEGLQNDLDFLATLELRSSEEDERQKALRKEMKEKKRIQQLQQIQELQLQQDAMQQAEMMAKMKDEKKHKSDEKKKEAMREKRMSTDRKSRDEKSDGSKRKNRKQFHSTDSSDSDEPKKHSIFDIVDDEPTYISMYDKVKARSCKNMQKQEEEKRQEKIKAKFSQLKQSRAKREEKKRSSWDEDSDTDQDKRKPQKLSMDSSSDEERMVNKKREKSQDYDRSKSNDYFSMPSTEEDSRNKLSRKNSRTRIVSDTSDDEISKRSNSKSPNFLHDIRKEYDFDSLQRIKTDDITARVNTDKIKKNSLLNLFGKSDSDDSKLKTSLESSDKSGFGKNLCNDFSSENESVILSRTANEVRRKHKKKQKKHKLAFSDDDRVDFTNDSVVSDTDGKHKNAEKVRRHNMKKEKRKDKLRESCDTEDGREDKLKIKKDKKITNNCFDSILDASSSNSKKEGKMEDIFGPLSDDSDRDVRLRDEKQQPSNINYDAAFSLSNDQFNSTINNEETRIKDKEESRRRKEKKRKERRPFLKEDDNSLDVDAVSKAIEARLFADSIVDDDSHSKNDSMTENFMKNQENDVGYVNKNLENVKMNEKHFEKLKKECKDKKKKKKRNKEDRQARKEHHHFNHHEKFDHLSDKDLASPKILDIPLPTDIQIDGNAEEILDDRKSLTESPSLPRLTDSPPLSLLANKEETDKKENSNFVDNEDDDSEVLEIDYDENKDIEINNIPMPPPLENTVQDLSEVPLPKEPVPIKMEQKSSDIFLNNFARNIDISEDAVRSISNLEEEKEREKSVERIDNAKVDKKLEEKPRAIISQEETEDAVAALLGESFGGKDDTFANCYEETESSTSHQMEIENAVIENENIPEEDAEEMRQAVQNLNASEMELKPDTPVSDSDLLLIDTDTEEADEPPQDALERLPINIIATNQSLNTEPEKSDACNDLTTKTKPTLDTKETKVKLNDHDIKLILPKRIDQQITSTATPVITSWTLTNNKPLEPINNKVVVPVHNKLAEPLNNKLLDPVTNKILEPTNKLLEQTIKTVETTNKLLEPPSKALETTNKLLEPTNKLLEKYVQSQTFNKESSENKPISHVTTNIVQIRPPHNSNVTIPLRPILTTTRVSAPYQVINHVIRPHIANMQPPTIKIPEPHILYQKSPGPIVISPRMSSDPRLQSPRLQSPRHQSPSPQSDGMASPRMTNMTILSTSPQNLNAVGMPSPSTLQQRSPGQVTVVRMQQPQLSPIQALHVQHGNRAMVSPSRPNSVLVQAQGTPIHFNRLPVTPVLAPISKQVNVVNNIMQQNKNVNLSTSPMIHQQKVVIGDLRKSEHLRENLTESSKIILSPTSLQHSTNPTVMAQNRLISMQNAIHAANSPLPFHNKVLVNNMSHLNDKRENIIQKSDQHTSYSTPIIHVAGVNNAPVSIIQTSTKPVICTVQDNNLLNRGQISNVIHAINSPKLLTTASVSNVIQIDANKGPPSVLSMATIRSPTVLTKLESSNCVAATTNSLTNVVMTPLLLKTGNVKGAIRLNTKTVCESPEIKKNQEFNEEKFNIKMERKTSPSMFDSADTPKDTFTSIKSEASPPTITKCETDFEELLKDNTNEIKVTNDPEKKLEVNVGKTVTLFSTTNREKQKIELIENIQDNMKKIERNEAVVQNTKKPPTKEIPSDVVKTESEVKIECTNEIKTEKLESTDSSTEPVVSKDNSIVDQSMTPNSSISLDKRIDCFKEDTRSNFISVPKIETENPPNSLIPHHQPAQQPYTITTSSAIGSSLTNHLENDDSQGKGMDENDSWSAKDVNIDSVIKKVDSLCNENSENESKNDNEIVIHETKPEQNLYSDKIVNSNPDKNVSAELESQKPMDIQNEPEKSSEESSMFNELSVDRTTSSNKRGGRNIRRKNTDKNQERVQTRQIAKPARGGAAAKRGRGRAKVEKKIKSLVNHNTVNIPGDVYDFHEDSGDESSNKTETRPRLILTIKSPHSGHSNATPTSTLSITPKDPIKTTEKITKDEKLENFISPSSNTRKSRRLLEKDVHRTSVDDIPGDVTKTPNVQTKGKDPNKKRQTRQTVPKGNQSDKSPAVDMRKSPRGAKRTRDRSLSDASIDSSDEKAIKREDAPTEPKVAKVTEQPVIPKMETDPPAMTTVPAAAPAPPVPPAVVSTVTSTPIMKPPKKMISEISAKLASAFETAAALGPVRVPVPVDRVASDQEKQPLRSLDITKPTPAPLEMMPAATGDVGGETFPTARAFLPRDVVVDRPVISKTMNVACGAEVQTAPCGSGSEAALGRRIDVGGMAPVGATEASDARVQSPALPHRPPSVHRGPERATPLLMRGGEGSGLAAGVGPAGGARAPRGVGGTPSLPRGAHHPPPPQPAPRAQPFLPHHPHAKQVAVVGPHHHPGASSRVTITNIPSISPQGQMALSTDLVRSPPPAHQQTSPVSAVYHNGEGMYPHFSHQHYQMYQQHFRATQQECRATPSPYTRSLEAEGCEAPTPPLELRRPPSARVPRPAHSPSPADRLIMYAAGCGRSPPPAHGTSRLAGALPPSAAPGPPHASQVPQEADSLQMLLRRYPVMWQGLLALKNDSAAVQMHFVGGNPGVAGDTLPRHTDGSTPPLRIAQRMRLEPAQLDQVHRKMKLENEHCILLALPCGRDHMDVLQQSTNLTGGFITYLQRKQAAGIVNVAPPGHHQAMYTVHIFPSCDFANENLNRIAPDLMHRVADIAHLLIVIATATA